MFVLRHSGGRRALPVGRDCAYIADAAVRPEHQGNGVGTAIIRKLAAAASGHKKIILYANPGAEGFYASGLGAPLRNRTVDLLPTIWEQGGQWRSVPQASKPMWVGCDRIGVVSLLHFAAARYSPGPPR